MELLATLSDEAYLTRKCRTAINGHRQAAKRDARQINYTEADLRELARRQACCHYCGAPLSWTFEFDHRMPIARSPNAHRLDNLVCACPGCNQAKGVMDDEEFRRLTQLIDSFHPAARADILARLRGGGRIHAEGRKV